MFKFILFLVAFDRLLTQEDLKKDQPSNQVKTEFVSQDENVGIQISKGSQVFELHGSLPKTKVRGPKGPNRAEGVKIAAGYKYITKPSKQTSAYYKAGMEANDPIIGVRAGDNSRTFYGIKGGMGYQNELDNGVIFFVDTGLSYPILKSEPHDPQQVKEKSSRHHSSKPRPEPAISVGFKF
ncbi:MAG: hypothetical protein FJZ60_00580 [Chlamydiae bacterium]|nr:hypothetical protein [Chlamydiota bacterium]